MASRSGNGAFDESPLRDKTLERADFRRKASGRQLSINSSIAAKLCPWTRMGDVDTNGWRREPKGSPQVFRTGRDEQTSEQIGTVKAAGAERFASGVHTARKAPRYPLTIPGRGVIRGLRSGWVHRAGA
ncbi:hypothetical protein Sfum_0516 [Syntrophobacter fumaroxidans MPOB]|uniref:Uncharacterized protein n=1 Tax=Syntrophobacter fumaroxidans (strain DSM 10017 / MPOB) TaxID=335543 RepID=A0LFL4_SYNFM|nr:hypothetical protein Sfum_0516 [Syntrophobacter fumaroxidans MPOB]